MTRLMIQDIFESKIIITGDSKEQLQQAKEEIAGFAGSRELDELLLTNLRNRIVRKTNKGYPISDIRDLAVATHYITSRYRLFYEIENVDLAIKMATHMINIADEEESMIHIDRMRPRFDPVRFVHKLDTVLELLEGKVVDTEAGCIIIDTYTAQDMSSAVKNISAQYPDLECKINWVEGNIGKFTKWFKGGEEFTPKLVKLVPSKERRANFK